MTLPILGGLPVGLGALAFLQDPGLGQEMAHLLRTHMWACYLIVSLEFLGGAFGLRLEDQGFNPSFPKASPFHSEP